jgi:acetylglutamate kinase
LNTKSGPSPDAAGVVLTFLESVGRRSEAELYLKLFRELPKESFAIIAAEAAVIRHAAGSLVEQLRFLRELGLFAPVAVGLFEPAAAEKSATRLAKRAAHMGAVVEEARDPELGARVREELDAENLPIVSFAGTEQESARDRFERVGQLAAELGTRKIVVLRRRGGLRRYGRSVLSPSTSLADVERGISVVNLRTDLDGLREPRALPSDDAELLECIGTILARPDCASVVAAVTSPLSLLHELFTVKGAGTLIKRGTAIERHPTYDSLDRARLVGLLESSFGRPLLPSFFEEPPLSIHLEEAYRAAAIVVPGKTVPYLTKFAVDRVAQGEGMGRDLWEAVAKDHSKLFWRARVENPIASWYGAICDGMLKVGSWAVYFRGVEPGATPALVEEALARPEDFIAPADG